jgi:hypothetical protein
MRGDRTHETARSGRRAHRRAELHEALVERAWRCRRRQRRHQRTRLGPQRLAARSRLDVELHREHACENARDVAIDERRALVVRDRCDRTRGVRPDARHRAQLGGALRQGAAPLRADLLRARPQVARARVVAEPGPRGEHVVERCGGERAHRRKLRHPPLPVRDHGRHARLLQHDLADPDRVRIARAPPRQVALHSLVMLDDSGRDRLRGLHPPLVATADQ